MTSDAVPPITVEDYLAQLPADRRPAISAVRDAINAKIAKGYEERLQYGMITWVVPESVMPADEVYNKQPLALASLGSQKSHMAVYLMGVYADPDERAWFEGAYKKSGKKLDMGKSCVRFASLEKLAVDVVAEAMGRVTVANYVKGYRALHAAKAPSATKGSPAKAGSITKKAALVAKAKAATAAKQNSNSAKRAPARK